MGSQCTPVTRSVVGLNLRCRQSLRDGRCEAGLRKSTAICFTVPLKKSNEQLLRISSRDVLTRLAGHEAETEARKSEAEDEAQKFFRGRGHNV